MTERPVGDHSKEGERKLKPNGTSLSGNSLLMGLDLALDYEETANSTPAQGTQPGMALFYKESHFSY